MDASFEEAFELIIGHEGQYSNRSPEADPGGETNWGISKRAYPLLDIKNLTKEGAKQLYFKDYWQMLPNTSPQIKYQLFDFAVNSGVRQAIKALQEAIYTEPDGHFGKNSYMALGIMDEHKILLRLLGLRLLFMTRLRNWSHNSKGWACRIGENLLIAAQDFRKLS